MCSLSLWKSATNGHRSLQIVACLQDLLSQVLGQIWTTTKQIVHRGQCLGGTLPVHRCCYPAPQKEDPAIALDPRQAVERLNEVGPRELLLRRIVKRAVCGFSASSASEFDPVAKGVSAPNPEMLC